MTAAASSASPAARAPGGQAVGVPRPIQVAARVAVAVAVVLLVAYAAICYRFADLASTVNRHPLDLTAAYVAPTHEDLTFTAADGTVLKGWWFAAPAPRGRAAVIVHGRDQDRIDSSFPTGRIARTLLGLGYSALLFDLYGHGESGGGPRWGLGKFEAMDVAAAVDLASQKAGIPHSRVGVIAESLGAGSSIMALNYVPDIGPMVLDSVYTDAYTVIREHAPVETGLPWWFVPGMVLEAKIFFGLDLNEVRPIDVVRAHPERAFFFIQCENDDTAFPHMGFDMKAASANPDTGLWFAYDCRHVAAYSRYPSEWEAHVIPFLESQIR